MRVRSFRHSCLRAAVWSGDHAAPDRIVLPERDAGPRDRAVAGVRVVEAKRVRCLAGVFRGDRTDVRQVGRGEDSPFQLERFPWRQHDFAVCGRGFVTQRRGSRVTVGGDRETRCLKAVRLAPVPIVDPVQLLRPVGRFEDVLVSRVDPHVVFQRHRHRRIGLVRVLAGHVEILHTRAQRVRHQNGRPSPRALRLDADRATVALVRSSQRQVDPVTFGVEDLAGPIRKGPRPRIERAELIALSVPDSQVDQTPANIPNRHIRVSTGERLSDHCGQMLVS